MPRLAAISKLEKNFLLKVVTTGNRIDERGVFDHRRLTIEFGADLGCCTVSLGHTKVLAQVTAELDRPKDSRGSEGKLGVNVELSALGSPGFKPGRPGELGIEIQRVLEKTIVFSRAVDLEELCVRVGEKCWNIQLYLHVLCHDGNILECASIAAITALKHFKRPCTTVIGQEVTVHSVEEKNPIPLTLHHFPFSVTFAFFKGCEYLLVDPLLVEENVMDGKLVVSMNQHREVCGLQMGGEMQLNKEQILRCINISTKKVQILVQFVREALQQDEVAKKNGEQKSSHTNNILGNITKKTETKVTQANHEIEIENPLKTTDEVKNNHETTEKKPTWLTKIDNNTASIGEGKLNSWKTEKSEAIFKALGRHDSDAIEDCIIMEQSEVGVFKT